MRSSKESDLAAQLQLYDPGHELVTGFSCSASLQDAIWEVVICLETSKSVLSLIAVSSAGRSWALSDSSLSSQSASYSYSGCEEIVTMPGALSIARMRERTVRFFKLLQPVLIFTISFRRRNHDVSSAGTREGSVHEKDTLRARWSSHCSPSSAP